MAQSCFSAPAHRRRLRHGQVSAAQPGPCTRDRDPVPAPPQASRWHLTSFFSVTPTKCQECAIRYFSAFKHVIFNNHIFSDNEVFLKKLHLKLKNDSN